MVIKRNEAYWVQVGIIVIALIGLLLLYVYGFSVSIGFAALINIPVFLMAILGLVSSGRTFILDEEGCTVCFLKFRKKYTWEQLKTKRIERHRLPAMSSARSHTPYRDEVIFTPHKVRKLNITRAGVYSLIHPFSCIFIHLVPENTNYLNGYYEVEESVFMQKMQQWGIDLEERKSFF